MEREVVQSSMFESIGYDSLTSIFEAEFKNGGAVWQYFDVPESIYYELRNAGSIGKYFLANIKGQYSESRIG
jgi:hypothetical protein